MEPLLYLVHRMPFPPNKGDKIRSYHLLRHLAERYAVHLGTFVDMPEDLAHVPQLEAPVPRITSRRWIHGRRGCAASPVFLPVKH